MADASILAAVAEILAAPAGRSPAELTAATPLDSLGLDSMALVEALFALEERFDVTIPFQAAAASAGSSSAGPAGAAGQGADAPVATLGELANRIALLRAAAATAPSVSAG